jgi:coenzyme PQQ precursor peptide PqqA
MKRREIFKLIHGRFSVDLISWRPVGYSLSESFESHAIDGTEEIMEWTAPVFEEICLNCEINSYASATL